ncbi:uncharacterized protein LOC117317163 isoform X1 [Pecten maximus]|uniref:uncharacterized protein LOC117317163 isoform X1 n=1 Tax=Pecten maximus TaxID=6579 RepID=UPI001458BFB2|nr:uncharacterized protein LOC117317163 isoform X1 [Pecten maximus]
MDYRGFITYTLCVFLFALSLCLSDVLETTVEDEDTDVPDHSFPSWTMVHNKNVTCGTIKPGLKFPSQTWTCADARVDGYHLAYSLYADIGVDRKCVETRGLDELAEVCLAMMREMDVHKPLWAALVTNATCGYHEGKRGYLKKVREGFEWVDMQSGHGAMYTFRCMAEKT